MPVFLILMNRANTNLTNINEKLDHVLNDQDVELVINLTFHHAHAEVLSSSILAGKHFHSKKPLAITRDDGENSLSLLEKMLDYHVPLSPSLVRRRKQSERQ